MIKGPDFPTGGKILGTDGILSFYETGHGGIVVQGKAYFESENHKSSGRQKTKIVITEIPYLVSKSGNKIKRVNLAKRYNNF